MIEWHALRLSAVAQLLVVGRMAAMLSGIHSRETGPVRA